MHVVVVALSYAWKSYKLFLKLRLATKKSFSSKVFENLANYLLKNKSKNIYLTPVIKKKKLPPVTLKVWI